MFNRSKKENEDRLDKAIAAALDELGHHDPDSESYQQIVTQLTELRALETKRVDPNTVLTVAGNIAIAVVVIGYEQKAVITTKVLPFLAKLK